MLWIGFKVSTHGIIRLMGAKEKYEKKKRKAVKRLIEFFEGDGFSVEEASRESDGKKAIGDFNFSYKRKKYPITVSRKENLPTSTLNKEQGDADMLIYRRNRENWKVSMELETLISLLLHNRS